MPQGDTFRWGGRSWGRGDQDKFRTWLRRHGSNFNTWSSRHPGAGALITGEGQIDRRMEPPPGQPMPPPNVGKPYPDQTYPGKPPPGAAGPGGGTQQPQAPWASDPILVQAQAAWNRRMANAESSALGERQRLLVEYGSPELARSLLGQGGESYASAAEQNPFSVLANLRRGYQQNEQGLNEGLNQRNLFYSSTRGDELGRLATGYQGQQAEAAGGVQSALDAISQNLLSGRESAEDALLSAQQEAYQRWLAELLASGGLPPR